MHLRVYSHLIYVRTYVRTCVVFVIYIHFLFLELCRLCRSAFCGSSSSFFFFFLHSGVRLRAHLRCQLRDRLRVRPHPRRGCWTPHAQRFGGLRSHGHHGGESVAGKTGAGGGSGCGLVLVMSLPVRWLLLFDVGVDVDVGVYVDASADASAYVGILMLLLPYTPVYHTHTPGVVFQARLLDSQEGANIERYVLRKLSAGCFQRDADLSSAPTLFQLWRYRVSSV